MLGPLAQRSEPAWPDSGAKGLLHWMGQWSNAVWQEHAHWTSSCTITGPW